MACCDWLLMRPFSSTFTVVKGGGDIVVFSTNLASAPVTSCHRYRLLSVPQRYIPTPEPRTLQNAKTTVIRVAGVSRRRARARVLLAAAVPRPGPHHVHPNALRQRLAHGLHVAPRLRAPSPPLAAPAVGRARDIRMRPGLLAQALCAKMVGVVGDGCWWKVGILY